MAKKKGHTRGYFSSKMFTSADVNSLFDASKEFRKMAIRAAQRLTGDRSVTLDAARDLALDMGGQSARVGRALGKYPHPGAMLAWLAKANLKDFYWGASESELEGIMLSIFAGGFRGPTRMAASWSKFLRSIANPGSITPFFFRQKVHALASREGGSHLGLRLARIKVRIPVNPRATSSGVVPGGFIERWIDFMALEETFGIVMLGLSSNAKTMWLSSQKGHGTRMKDLIAGRTMLSGTTAVPAKFETLYPGRDVTPKLPESVKKLLAEKTVPGSERAGDTVA